MTLWDAVPADASTPGDDDHAEAEVEVETWTVAEIGAAIGDGLRARFPGEIWLRGEISSLRPPGRTGHQYFDLIEPGAEPGGFPDAKLSVSLFRNNRSRVLQALTEASADAALANGVEVRIRGRVDWWTGGGQLRLVMSAIDPVFTLGRLDADRRALLARLVADGLLDANGKLPVPPVPLRVGLITSAGSAAHADFVDELRSSRYAFDVVLVDARVQGADATRTLVAAVDKVTRLGVDVIAIVRGGGSRTDLVAFDHADVAYAIARSPLPVFTGIGHEIDRSVADEVAHSAFKTPTAAAGALVARVAAAESTLDEFATRLAAATTRRLTTARAALDARTQRVARAARVADTRANTHLNGLRQRLEANARRTLRDQTRSVATRSERLRAAPHRHLARASERLDAARGRVDAFDPARILARGWSLSRTADGQVVRSAGALAPGATMITTFHDGTATATVSTTELTEGPS